MTGIHTVHYEPFRSASLNDSCIVLRWISDFTLYWRILLCLCLCGTSFFILTALIVVYGSCRNRAASDIVLNGCLLHYSSFENWDLRFHLMWLCLICWLGLDRVWIWFGSNDCSGVCALLKGVIFGIEPSYHLLGYFKINVTSHYFNKINICIKIKVLKEHSYILSGQWNLNIF